MKRFDYDSQNTQQARVKGFGGADWKIGSVLWALCKKLWCYLFLLFDIGLLR